MIRIENISKVYEKPVRCAALRDISLVFPDTGLVVVAGESGSGKTTLVNILSGLDTPTSGSVEKDFDVPGAYVFQDNRMIDELTLEENLRLAADITGEKPDIPAYLSRYGLEEVKDHTPNRLSAGQNQRAAVLRAVLMNRAVIFADEPTGNLDRENAERVAALLKEESAKRLVITVTHDRELFGKYADRIIELDKGKVIRDDAVRESHVTRAVCGNVKPKLPAGTAALISARAMLKSLPRVIAVSVIMFACLTLIAVSLNIVMTDPVTSKYGIARDGDSFTYDVSGIADPRNHSETRELLGDLRSVSDEEYADLSSRFDTERFRDMSNIFAYSRDAAVGDNVVCTRYYLADRCFFPVVAGSPEIGENETAVPESMADFLFGGADEAVGEEIVFGNAGGGEKTLTVSAVYADRTDRTYFATSDQTYECVMREETLAGICGMFPQSKIGLALGYEVSASSAFMISDGENPGYGALKNVTLTEGRLPERAGEICVSEDSAEDNDLSVGDELPVSLTGVDDKSETRVYTVVGLCAGWRISSGIEIVMSDEEYPETVYRYGTRYNNPGDGFGVALKNYDLASVKTLHDLGYCDDMYFTAAARKAASETLYIGLFSVAAASAVLVVALLTATLFAGHLVSGMRQTMGVLRSLGINKPGLIKLLLLQPLAMLVAASALTLAAQPPLVLMPVNFMIVCRAGQAMRFLYYSFPASLAAIGFAALVLALSVAVMHFRMSRRTAIDIIYER